MLILTRAYIKIYDVVNTKTGKIERFKQEDIYELFKQKRDIFRISIKGYLEKINEEEFEEKLYITENMFFYEESSTDYISLYRLSPAYKKNTFACYDIYICEKTEYPICAELCKNMMIGGSKNDHFIDEIVTDKDENGNLFTTCLLRKHVHAGHKEHDEYHSKWVYTNNLWEKEDWTFKDNRKGW